MNSSNEQSKAGDPAFTGERFVPGKAGSRIEADHLERYYHAVKSASKKRVLDIACGVGYGAPLFMEAGAKEYVGVDISDESIAYANKTFGGTNRTFSVGDICALTSAVSFDLIVCFETIEHIAAYKEALANLYTLLTPGGTLLISSPHRWVTSPKAIKVTDKPLNKYHTQEYTPKELTDALTEAGFKVKKEILGQRQRPWCKSSFVRMIVRTCGIPDIFAFLSSPKLKQIKGLTPRYFVMTAWK